MSSILEALKKLEAEKNSQQIPLEEPVPAYPNDFGDSSFVGRLSHSEPRQNRTSSITLVLAGGIFTILLVAVSVFLAIFFMEHNQPPPPVTALAPPVAEPPISEPEPAEEDPFVETAIAANGILETRTAPANPPPRTSPRPKPDARPERVEAATLLPASTEVRYEPFVPEPPAGGNAKRAPLPDDIRKLPMMSRNEKAQYRLEDVKINMLNEANALRPLGNALINLEKVFIGETLPGTNAVLIDVKNNGIAVEILSTRQRYYIPR